MAKHSFNWTPIVVVVIVLVAVGGFIYWVSDSEFTLSGLFDKLIDIDIGGFSLAGGFDSGDDDDDDPPQQVDQGIDICGTLTDNYPAYMTARELTCISFSGDWRCKRDKAGCYNIPSWNNSQCNTNNELQALKLFCASVGAHWHCTASTIACER